MDKKLFAQSCNCIPKDGKHHPNCKVFFPKKDCSLQAANEMAKLQMIRESDVLDAAAIIRGCFNQGGTK